MKEKWKYAEKDTTFIMRLLANKYIRRKVCFDKNISFFVGNVIMLHINSMIAFSW